MESSQASWYFKGEIMKTPGENEISSKLQLPQPGQQ